MSTTTQALILGFCAVQGLFLCIALSSVRKKNSPGNILLLALIAVVSVFLIRSALWRTGLMQQYPHLFATLWPLAFGIGPLLYFYTKSNTSRQLPLDRRFWIHFAPILVSALLLIPIYSLSGDEKATFVPTWPPNDNYLSAIFNMVYLHVSLTYAQLLVYCTLSLRLLKGHQNTIKNEFSYSKGVDLKWLRYIVFICLMGAGAGLTFSLLVWIKPHDYLFTTGFLSSLLLALTILAAGFMGIRQPALFDPSLDTATKTGQPSELTEARLADKPITLNTAAPANDAATLTPTAIADTRSKKTKYSKSGISEPEAAVLKEELINLMLEQKLYLDGDLSLSKLSQLTTLPKNSVSQVINDQIGKNFHDFVNGYRVAAAKEILNQKEYDRVQIVDIAMKVGFNSKTSFYTAFKKETNLTPIKYRSLRNT